jgi:hypothetical protein
MKILFAILNLALLAIIIYRHRKFSQGNQIKSFYWPGLVLKALGGIALGLIYMYYYQIAADTILFFEDSKKLTGLARTDFLSYIKFLFFDDPSHPLWTEIVFQQSRSLFIVKITSLFGLITLDNYWITSLYFSVLSFICAWRLTTCIVESFPSVKTAAVTAFLFFPSVVFWSSGLIKESIAMAALFFLSAAVVRIWVGKQLPWWEWALVILSAWIEWRLKYYYLAVFLPVAAAALITRRLSHTWHLKGVVIKSLLWTATFVFPLALISSLRPNFYPARILHVIVSNYREFYAMSDVEDVIEYPSLEPTVSSVLTNIPRAIVSGIFRPFPWEAHTMFQWVIAIENLILLLLFITSAKNITLLVKSRQRLLLCSILLYVGVLCVFLALSTPNFGTLSRYRISFLPFLVLLISIENPLVKKLSDRIQRS